MKKGGNEYSDVNIAGHPTQASLFNLTGPIAAGDFGSGLLSIFREENAAAFSFRELTDGPQGREYVFDFSIPAAKNRAFNYYERSRDAPRCHWCAF